MIPTLSGHVIYRKTSITHFRRLNVQEQPGLHGTTLLVTILVNHAQSLELNPLHHKLKGSLENTTPGTQACEVVSLSPQAQWSHGAS